MSINFLLIIFIVAFVYKIADGYKKGMVKEIVSLISIIVICVMLAIIAGGIMSYLDGNFVSVVVAVVLLLILGVGYHFLNLVLVPAKLAAKLPLISFVDKLLGIVFGVLEVVLVIWTVYTLVMIFYMGNVGEIILSYTKESAILSWFYEHNYLAYLVEALLGELPTVN